ncbi:MAG: hypothetical protein ACYCTY_16445 [Sulfuricella sp.]
MVDLFNAGAKPSTPRRKPAVAGNTIYVDGKGHAFGQIAGGDIHNHINEKKVFRPKIVRGPEYISSAVARKIQGRINTLVDMGVAASGDTKKLYAAWHSKLKNHFGVPSYLEIPAHLEQHAIDWLQQQKALQRPKIRRADNDMWRAALYPGLWTRASKLGMSKADVYNLAFERMGVKIVSLKQLGERNLKALYDHVMRQKP